MNRSDIIQKVMAFIDEYTPIDEGLINATEYSKPIHAYIDEILDDAVKELFNIMPSYLLPNSTITAQSVSTTDGVVSITLNNSDSNTFIKLATLKLPTWKRAVTTTISNLNPKYSLQKNEFTRGKDTKPVVAIVTNNGGNIIFECYSTNNTYTSMTNIDCRIIKSMVAESLPERLIVPLCYICCELIYMAFEKPVLAKQVKEKFIEHVQLSMK